MLSRAPISFRVDYLISLALMQGKNLARHKHVEWLCMGLGALTILSGTFQVLRETQALHPITLIFMHAMAMGTSIGMGAYVTQNKLLINRERMALLIELSVLMPIAEKESAKSH
jgi:hypothetical protein